MIRLSSRSLTMIAVSVLVGSLRAATWQVRPDAVAGGDGSAARPFATLEEARDALRNARAGGRMSGEPVTIVLAAGIHRRSASFELSAVDGGTAAAPVVWRAAIAGKTVLSSGVAVPAAAWRQVSDPAMVARFDPAVRTRILRLPLADLDVRNAGRYADVFADGGGLCQLFCGGGWMPLSRWPDSGYETIKTVLDKGDLKGGAGTRGGRFVYRSDRPARWNVAEGVWLDGFWVVPWTRQALRVAAIDPQARTIAFAGGVGRGIGSKYARPPALGTGKETWCAVNLPEEIDRPGEWCIRFGEQALYFLPSAGVKVPGDAVIADRKDPLVRMKGVEHLAWEGVVFEGGLGDGVEIVEGVSAALRGCVFRLLGGTGATIRSGRGHAVQSCDFHDLGRGGVVLGGGDRRRLVSAGHTVDNCRFWRVGRLKQTYAPPIECLAGSVGCRVTHNFMHDLPHAGVLYSGNNHLFEYNEVARAALDSGDVGAFYTTFDWTSRGNVLRYNFVYDSPAINAFYLDDGDSGDTVVGNVVYNTQYGPFISGGHDNCITGNLVIACSVGGLHLDTRGLSRGYRENPTLLRKLGEVDTANPPWSVQYPSLARMDPDTRGYPVGNRIADNAVVACGQPEHFGGKPAERRFSTVSGSVVIPTVSAAGFRDSDALDFRPRPDSEILRRWPLIRSIPFDRIGLYVDRWRPQVPDRLILRREAGRVGAEGFDSMTDARASGL